MAVKAVRHRVRPSEREARVVVVETVVRVPRRMASEAGRRIVRITIYAHVFIVRFGVQMAADATELRIVRRGRVALDALAPFARMCARVYREILTIMVKIGGLPFALRMAGNTVRGKLGGLMVRVSGGIVFRLVAAKTSVRRIVVIPIVAGRTVAGDGGVCTIQWIKIVVDVKRGGHPIRLRRVALRTVRRQAEGIVVRVG